MVDLGTLPGVNLMVVAGGVRFIWLLVGYDIKTLVSSQALFGSRFSRYGYDVIVVAFLTFTDGYIGLLLKKLKVMK